MGLLQNLSKRGRLSEKVFDTFSQKIHAQAELRLMQSPDA